MKIVCCIMLVGCSVSAFGQWSKLAKDDTLSKYTYSLLTLNLKDSAIYPYGGSCFFIRRGGGLFLITSQHVLTGCIENGARLTSPEALDLWMRDSTDFPTKSMKILLNHYKNYPCPQDSAKPDVAIISLRNVFPEINSIEKYIVPRFHHPADIDIYGFPGYVNLRGPTGYAFSPPSHLHIESDTTFWRKYLPDTISMFVVNKHFRFSDSMRGYSGSPIFLRDSITGKRRVMGIFSIFGYDTADPNANFWTVPPIEYICEMIDKLIVERKTFF